MFCNAPDQFGNVIEIHADYYKFIANITSHFADPGKVGKTTKPRFKFSQWHMAFEKFGNFHRIKLHQNSKQRLHHKVNCTTHTLGNL